MIYSCNIRQLYDGKEVIVMAVPKRRHSKARTRKGRTHFKLEVPGMVKCSECGEYKLSHRICKECGSYKGEIVTND